jgi:hypothetical protein
MNELSVVIPLGSGSTRQNIELKYALRSIEKNLKGVKNIIIVGEKPSFLSDEIIHIPLNDCGRKQLSIKRKIEAAIKDERCTETFLFSNDDIFQLKKQRIDTYPYYYSGDLPTVREKGARHTENRLKQLNKPTKQFDCHFPILYTKEGFKEAMSAFDWANEDHLIKSSYANYHEIKGTEIKDLKISTHLNYQRIKQEIEGRPCYSIGDYCDFHEMLKVWNELFPEPSKYELINIKQSKAA